MATLASDLINETKRYLYSGYAEEMNRVSGAMGSGDTSMTLKYPLGGIARGVTIAIDLEEIRVWDTSGQTASVIERGINGTTAAAHSDLAAVTVKPKFSDFRILKAINNDLKDLSTPANGLYQVQTITLTFNSAIRGYDLTSIASNFLGILEVRYDTPGPDKNWPIIDSYSVMRNMPASAFASGSAIVLNKGGSPGRSIQVRYKGAFNALTNLSDDVQTTTGLLDSMNDLPPLGAAIRLVSPRDIKRTFNESQGEPRRQEEVPPGSGGQSLRALMMLRSQRIQDEAARLTSLYPWAQLG